MSRGGALIRPATPADVASLAWLRYEFRAERRPVVEAKSEFLQRCLTWMTPRLQPDAAWRCWVAVDREKLVGTLWLQLVEKLPNPGEETELHGYISSVYVIPERRKAGIGSALLDACLRHCDAVGVDTVFLWCTPGSRSLYQRHGFAIRDDLMDRRRY